MCNTHNTLLSLFRENEALPPGRCRDDGDGGLEISSVEARDSGVYICVARLGAIVNTARANLTVSETGPHNCNAHQSEGWVVIFKYNLQMQVKGAFLASCLQTLIFYCKDAA